MAEVPNALLMVTAGAQLRNLGEEVSIRDNKDWEGKKSKWETNERANWRYRNMKLIYPDPRPRKLELPP